MRRKKILVYTGVVLSMLFFSISFVWSKQVLQFYTPVTTIFFRMLISSAFLLLFRLFSKQPEKIDSSDIKKFFLLALIDPFLYFLCEGYGLKYVAPTIASVMTSTIPLITPFFAYFIYREKLTLTNIIGAIISFLGVLLIIINNNIEHPSSFIGIIFLSCAVVCSFLYLTLLKDLSSKYNPITIITYQNTFSILFFLPLFLIFDVKHVIEIGIKSEIILPLLQLSIFASCLAFIFYVNGLKKVGVFQTSMLINIIPVFTALFSFMILGEIINIQKIIGIIIVIGGLFIAQGKNAIFGTRPRIFWYVYLLGKNFTDNFKSKNKNQKNYED